VLQKEILILEVLAVDGLAASACSGMSKVTSLGHEAGDDTVNDRVCIMQWLFMFSYALLASAESAEIFTCLGRRIEEIHGDTAAITSFSCLSADAYIKEDFCCNTFSRALARRFCDLCDSAR